MGFANEHRAKEQSAAEHKAQEYEALTKRVSSLEKSMQDMTSTMQKLNTTLQGITPEDIEKFKQEGKSVFEPMRKVVVTLRNDFQSAGQEAAEEIRQAGRKSLKEFAIRSFFTAAWFVALTLGVQYFAFFSDFKRGGEFYDSVVKIANSINMIHFNQTMPGANFSPWDWDAFWEAWQNQNQYIANQREQATNGKATQKND